MICVLFFFFPLSGPLSERYDFMALISAYCLDFYMLVRSQWHLCLLGCPVFYILSCDWTNFQLITYYQNIESRIENKKWDSEVF